MTEKFIQDVETALIPGKTAVVAAIDEDLVKPVDERMEQIGGVVFRRPCSVVKTTEHDWDVAAHQVELQQRKSERQRARAERLAVIDAQIDKARAKLEAGVERRRSKMRANEAQREAKIKALEAKAEQAEGEARQQEEDRITKLRRDYADMAMRLPDSKSSK